MAKIPEHAKKVFSGVIFDIYQWEQEMYDGSTEIFETLKRPGVVTIIAVVGEKILIQEQEQPHLDEPFFCLPGGRLDPGEEALDAGKRELLEETGYVSDEWILFDSWTPPGKIDWSATTYIARNCQREGEPNLDAGEKISLQLWSFEQILDAFDEQVFQRHIEVRSTFVRAKYHEPSREELRKIIFGG